MKLTRARVTNFKSIEDTGWVTIDDVTCMVGKNESGKTAFLHALRHLSPVTGVSGDFDIKDYPRKGYVRYKRIHPDRPATVVTAEFKLTGSEVEEVESVFGEGVLESDTMVISKGYDNQLHWDFQANERMVIESILASANLPVEIQHHAWDSNTLEQLTECLEDLPVKPASVQSMLEEINTRFSGGLKRAMVDDCMTAFLPRFVYFDDYSAMRGRISIQDIRRRVENDEYLDDADRTFLSLLKLVGAKLEDLENQISYEYLKAEVESASIEISDEIFEFWNQNKQLRVEFDLSAANPNDPPPLNQGTILHVRIWNNRHRVSVPFDERSKGFVWFFSFLSYFSTLEEEEDADLILLLDEPGLNLHAMAQRDFLRFISDRLAPKNQVVYSTHSPFMINLDKLSSVRTVQDVDDRGTFVSDDTLSNDRETVFPIQVALGYQMAQTLFLAPHCLMVNYPSDLIYIQVLGEAVASTGQMRLDPRWVVIPVGGADNLPTFISTLGENYVSVAVMMDVSTKNRVKLDQINRNAAVKRHNPIKWVEVAKVRTADIEDLFEPTFYLKLVNEAYAGELHEPVTMKSITESNPRIVQRLDSYFRRQRIAGGRFDPYRPAALLLKRHSQLRGMISDPTVERAASLFERINSVLPSNGASEGGINAAAARVLAPIS